MNIITFKSNSNDKNMSNGQRDLSRTLLQNNEIDYIKKEIRRIEADESIFVFNDIHYLAKSTCYGIKEDKIYVTRNVFPDDKYGSTHPRDLMSVAAVLAHEYYGHRTFRNEYLKDLENDNNKWTTPPWQDECRASITAAKITPNLTDLDRSYLIQDAIYRAREAGHLIEMDDFMKGVLYGYSDNEKNITRNIIPINYISEKSLAGIQSKETNFCEMPEMRRNTKDYFDFER